MHARPFAHSYPVWIKAVGGTDSQAYRSAALDIIRAIDTAEQKARAAYREVEMSLMMDRFDEVHNILREMERAGK